MFTPARPVLASTLLGASRLKRCASGQPVDAAGVEPTTTRRRASSLRTGYAIVDDDVLNKGFNYGRGGVVGVACDETRIGIELAYSTLTSHLLDHPRSQAFYIDTSKTFDPRRLHKMLVTRLEAQKTKPLHTGGYVYHSPNTDDNGDPGDEAQSAEMTAMAALDRVRMMRVFDLEGLMDAVLEVRARIQGRESKSIAYETTRLINACGVEAQIISRDGAEQAEAATISAQQRMAVADSQTSSDVSDLENCSSEIDDDDDMLLDLAGHEAEDTAVTIPPTAQIKLMAPLDESRIPEGPYLLVMPSPARILSSCMHTNHIRTHGLLVHLMRTLQLLTRTYAVCILLVNTTVEHESTTASGREDGPSAFSSNTRIKPALGKTWDWYLDLSCMISTTFASGHGKEGVEQLEAENQQCFEVLHDRYDLRKGRWTVMRPSV